MPTRRLAVTLAVPCRPVFNFLADIEHLPHWAGGYYERLWLGRHGWQALSADGEQAVELDADNATGVIEVRAGPSPGRMASLRIDVRELAARHTLVSLTLSEAPGEPGEAFARRCAIWAELTQDLPESCDFGAATGCNRTLVAHAIGFTR